MSCYGTETEIFMKTKYSVIPFIPAVIAAIGLKIMSMFAVDGNGLLFGMNKSGINYFIIEIILGLFTEFCTFWLQHLAFLLTYDLCHAEPF